MSRMKSSFADTVELVCKENDKILTGEILDFKRGYMLTVSVDRQVKITLRYNTADKNYIGRVGSLEFISKGPKETVTLQGQRG